MYIVLLIWVIFLFAYIAFNIYGVVRVIKMRIKGDLTRTAVLAYLLAIFIIITVTLIWIGNLNWGTQLKLY